MFDANGQEIKDASPFRLTMILTCSNGDYDYIPSALGFAHGGYSVDSCKFLPGTGEKLSQSFVSMLAGLYQST